MSSEPRRPDEMTAADLVPPQSPDNAPQQPTLHEPAPEQEASTETPPSTEPVPTEPALHDTHLYSHDTQPLEQPVLQQQGQPEDTETQKAQSASESPESSQPETPQPESSRPETPQPETAQPETAQPETAQPETAQPETALMGPDPAEQSADVGGAGSEQAIESELAEDEQDVSEDIEETVSDEEVAPLELNEESDEEQEKKWYILKVQVNREESIRDALQRRVKIEGLDDYFGEVIVPTEDVAEFSKSGKRRIVKKKLYPGYIMVNMVINDDTWFLVRETPGIGDFTGSAGKPTAMDTKEVERILSLEKPDEEGAQPRPAIPFKLDDRVRVKDGNFQNFEGEVSSIDEANGRVTVMINIFNRTTPVEFEHWQIEKV